MASTRLIALTVIALAGFAANSLICRIALTRTAIDPASFTTIRLASGAAVLWLIAGQRRGAPPGGGSWPSACALVAYAAGFSLAYVHLTASTGALLLFGAVQATMIGHGIGKGERLGWRQFAGLATAFTGLIGLVLPGLSAPPPTGALLMAGAGIAWGVYSLRGRGAGDPIRVTAGNFLRATPIAVGLSLVTAHGATVDQAGCGWAIASGALASGIGYAIWYTALPGLRATQAATVQLSVPVIAALGGAAFLGEVISPRLIAASAAILGGIALVVLDRPRASGPRPSTTTDPTPPRL